MKKGGCGRKNLLSFFFFQFSSFFLPSTDLLLFFSFLSPSALLEDPAPGEWIAYHHDVGQEEEEEDEEEKKEDEKKEEEGEERNGGPRLTKDEKNLIETVKEHPYGRMDESTQVNKLRRLVFSPPPFFFIPPYMVYIYFFLSFQPEKFFYMPER